MRTRVALTLLLAVGCTKPAPAPTPPISGGSASGSEPAASADPETETGPVIDASGLDTGAEAVGPIRQGMTADDVVTALGEPDAKPKFVMMEATGEFVSDWRWESKGLSLMMAANDQAGTGAVVSGISCSRSCAFGLPWGLKIGSTRAEVEAVYGDAFDPDFTNEESFVAGSVYGGAFYAFEDGKVVGIFIGAGAE